MTDAPIYSVHLSTAQSWRGGENQLWLLARGLQARGQRVLVVAPPGAPLLERCQSGSVPAVALGVRNSLDLWGTWKFSQLLRREKPDVMHLHDGHGLMPGKMAAAFCSSRPKLVAHRRTAFGIKGKWKFQGRVDRIVAISQAVESQLLGAGLPASLLRVVYSGLEFRERLDAMHPAVSALRRQLGLAEDAFVLGHVAALSAEKRQGEIIEALSLFNQKLEAMHKPPGHLVIAGCGAQEASLRALVASRGIADQVHFVGFLADTQPVWALSTVAVFASEAEGLCTALVEAQAAGLPAVITRAGGMTEVIAEEQTGLSVEVGAVEALNAAFRRLYDDESLRKRMGAQAAVRARERFGAEQMVEKTLAVYKELLAPVEKGI